MNAGIADGSRRGNRGPKSDWGQRSGELSAVLLSVADEVEQLAAEGGYE